MLELGNLDMIDELLVADALYARRPAEFLTSEECTKLWSIIFAWQSQKISAAVALDWLDSNDLLDPNETMLGWVAVQRAKNIPLPQPPRDPIAGVLEVPEGEETAFDVLAEARARRIA